MKKEVKIVYMMLSKDWSAFLNIYKRWSTDELTDVRKNFMYKFAINKNWQVDIVNEAIERSKIDEISETSVCKNSDVYGDGV